MKPRIFIGSSVKGLDVAYSIQQNLTHDAEVTVWDQGVFELSNTTIESLVKVLNKSDFGIFVFSNDDIIKIREEEKNTVRDNVLFEFGLFIGKLSRERVYFVIPSNTDLHLPTDLIGITPGKYSPNREDGSLQAATGPVCNQIKHIIKRLGRTTTNEETAKLPESKIEQQKNVWVDDFYAKKYKNVIQQLEALIEKEKEPDKLLKFEIWKAYCEFKIKETYGIELFSQILIDHPKNIIASEEIAMMYMWENYFDKSIEILKPAIDEFDQDASLVILLSECLKITEGHDKAIDLLMEYNQDNNIEITIEIANMLEDRGELEEAREIIHRTYQNFPNNEKIKYKYALIALELNENNIALFLLDSLTDEYDNKSSYWGYLSNCAVVMEYYNMALGACKKAEELTESKEEWILSNIGNILKNKGFYSEGIKYLEKGLKINKNSDYAHDRLATSIKLRNKEREKVKSSCRKGRKLLLEYRQIYPAHNKK